MQVICVRRERKYFCKEDWTGRHSLNCLNKSSCAHTYSSALPVSRHSRYPSACHFACDPVPDPDRRHGARPWVTVSVNEHPIRIEAYHHALCRPPEPGRFEVTGGPPGRYLCLDLSAYHAGQSGYCRRPDRIEESGEGGTAPAGEGWRRQAARRRADGASR